MVALLRPAQAVHFLLAAAAELHLAVHDFGLHPARASASPSCYSTPVGSPSKPAAAPFGAPLLGANSERAARLSCLAASGGQRGRGLSGERPEALNDGGVVADRPEAPRDGGAVAALRANGQRLRATAALSRPPCGRIGGGSARRVGTAVGADARGVADGRRCRGRAWRAHQGRRPRRHERARRLRAKASAITDTRGSARELGVMACGIPDARAAEQVKGGGVRRSSQAPPPHANG